MNDYVILVDENPMNESKSLVFLQRTEDDNDDEEDNDIEYYTYSGIITFYFYQWVLYTLNTITYKTCLQNAIVYFNDRIHSFLSENILQPAIVNTQRHH